MEEWGLEPGTLIWDTRSGLTHCTTTPGLQTYLLIQSFHKLFEVCTFVRVLFSFFTKEKEEGWEAKGKGEPRDILAIQIPSSGSLETERRQCSGSGARSVAVAVFSAWS